MNLKKGPQLEHHRTIYLDKFACLKHSENIIERVKRRMLCFSHLFVENWKKIFYIQIYF
jgi:hypothetical protein